MSYDVTPTTMTTIKITKTHVGQGGAELEPSGCEKVQLLWEMGRGSYYRDWREGGRGWDSSVGTV